MSDEKQAQAAAELADRYIEIILSTQPELLVGPFSGLPSRGHGEQQGTDIGAIQARASVLAHYRQSLIQNLLYQTIPSMNEAE